MKKFAFLMLSLAMAISGSAQDVLGRWYSIEDDGLIEINISIDSLKGQLFNTGQDNGSEKMNIKHSGIFTIRDKSIIVIPDHKSSNSTTTYRALTIFNIKDRVSMEIAANGINTPAKTIDELVDLSKDHYGELFGHILFSSEYLSTLGQLKGLDLMSIEEFKLFLKNYVEEKERVKNREQLMPGTFQSQLITRSLIGMGFNPMNRKGWLDRFLEMYLTDKVVEGLWRRM